MISFTFELSTSTFFLVAIALLFLLGLCLVFSIFFPSSFDDEEEKKFMEIVYWNDEEKYR